MFELIFAAVWVISSLALIYLGSRYGVYSRLATNKYGNYEDDGVYFLLILGTLIWPVTLFVLLGVALFIVPFIPIYMICHYLIILGEKHRCER